MARTAWDTTPTDYQARLLLAALDDSQHRIPSAAKKRTLEIMSRREWIRARRLTSTLAAAESGVTVYVLTHHGVNAAQRVRTAQFAQKYPVGAGAFLPAEGATQRDVVVVNSRPAADGTVEVLSMNRGGEAVRVPLAKLEELPELPPSPEGEITDWWTITDAQGAELARVQAEDDPGARKAAMRHAAVVAAARRDKGFAVRRLYSSELSAPVGDLRGQPRVSPAPAARVRWAVKDREGNLITHVEATSYNDAVLVADQDPKVRAAAPGAGGLVFMRASKQPQKPIPAAAPSQRTVMVRTEYVGRSIPSRLEAAGAPGEMQYSRKAGALRWVLPDGEELTPGQAEKRFLSA